MHLSRRAAVAALTAVGVLAGASAAPAATPQKVGPPGVMTALGDSITRGFHTGAILQDVPANSWSTGTNTTVNSLCLRIKAIKPTMNCGAANPPNGGNDAVTGAKVAGTNAQAVNAVARNPKPELVTILIGANDVCTSTAAGMTPITNFRASIDQTLTTLSTGLPDARIQVMSVPNIFNLWNVGRVSASARLSWGLFSVCQSMLANPTSTAAADVARRATVQQRNVDFNTQLQQACAQFVHCRFDNNAAYNLPFVLSDLSTIDFFHPNIQGQAKAASVAWTAGPNYADTTAPTTTISRDRAADGSDDWYRDSVTVTLTAADADLAGSEYFYKLTGAQDKPWTRYSGPFTVSDAGSTDVVARSVDVNGNIEASKTDVIKIDRQPPSFSLSCTGGLLNGSATATISGATDDRSDFAEDPNGDQSLDTSAPGHGLSSVSEIQDRAGNVAQRTCAYDVDYNTPGAPVLTDGVSPNATGVFTLSWTGDDPAQYDIRYTLQHRDADDASFSDVLAGLAGRSHAFTPADSEGEGTWTYRVSGADAGLGLQTAASPASAAVKVDRSAPAAPTFAADRAPDYTGDGGWYRDTVTVSATDHGDPGLQDGSDGTGVDPATVPAPATRSASGPHTIGGTVADRVGNVSAPGALGVKVDATAPDLTVTCPAAVLLHAAAAATVAASDLHSGLASNPSGTRVLNTGAVGPQITSATATDNVGHGTSRSCTTAVRYLFGGLEQPVNPDGSSIFKLGSTIPVKFRLTDIAGAGVDTAIARLEVLRSAQGVNGSVVEEVATLTPTDGNLFKAQGDGKYHFNLKTKGLTTGPWLLNVVLDDGTQYATPVTLR